MSKSEIFKRYLILTIGIFIVSLGVAAITKANLGTSPISAVPYVLSLYFPLTLGQFTIIFNLILFVAQLALLRKNFKASNILQIPVSFMFGYFIDFSMFLLRDLEPETYIFKLFMLVAGCTTLAFGVYTELLADVVMLPADSFVRAVVSTIKGNFGTTKIIFDVSMTLTGASLSFLFMNHLEGVREGTIVSALLVGFIAGIIGKQLGSLPEKLFNSTAKLKETSVAKLEESSI